MPADRLKQFFTPMVRRAFWELGLGEREIIDYVSDVLSGFARTDHLYRLRSAQGKPMDSVVEMRGEATPAGRSRIEWERDLRKFQIAAATSPGEDPFAEFLRQIEGWQRIGISDN